MTFTKEQIHDRTDEFLDVLIREKFSASLLSNAKWVKLIHTLVKHSHLIKECKVQPVWDDQTVPHRKLMIDKSTQHGHDFYDSSLESMVSGSPRGWYVYREIEWLDFPKKTEEGVMQDLDTIEKTLETAGKFVIERTAENLRLLAYYRKK